MATKKAGSTKSRQTVRSLKVPKTPICNVGRPITHNRKELKKLLKDIVAFLNTDSYDSAYLWHILTALRGPDTDRPGVVGIKDNTTARIRGAIGIRTERVFGASINYAVPQYKLVLDKNSGFYITDTQYVDTTGFHFMQHYHNALTALIALGYVDKEKANAPE